jgi:hypothetical protein
MNLPNLKALRFMTMLLVVSLSVVSAAGAFLPGTYARDSASMAAQGAGQDMVDLFLVVPLLIVTFVSTSRGNRLGTLLYAGTLFYILYSFIIYCFGVFFNQWFLLYCLTLALSLYSFILVMSGLKGLNVDGWFNRAPAKPVSIFIVFVALVFYTLWLKSLVPAIINKSVPVELMEYKLPVNAVHVIDLAFALPGLILGSVLLWRGKGMGYVIASVALVFIFLLSLALAAMVIVLAGRELSEDLTVAYVFGGLTLVSILVAVLWFRRIRS